MIRVAAGFFGELPLPLDRDDCVAVQFTLSPERLSDTEILDSGHASVGRFVGEILRRVGRMYPRAAACLAINPRLQVSPELCEAVLASALSCDLSAGGADAWVFSDASGNTPLAYMLRSEIVGWCPPVHLGLLTCVQVELDHRFLHTSFSDCQRVQVRALKSTILDVPSFAVPATVSPAMQDFARLAITRLEQAVTRESRRALIADGERIALVCYHAGDVLFLLQALALEKDHHRFTGVVVPADYADIVKYLCPELRCFVIKQPVPQRGGYHVVDEIAVLAGYVKQLESEGLDVAQLFWHPMRPSFHDFSKSRHHLREMLAMALGGPGYRLRPQPLLSPESQRDYARAQPQPGRVIIQLDAGWALKGFPEDRRGELLRLLRSSGYDPVLLGSAWPENPDVPATQYTSLQEFRTLLESAAAFIGCDSFPTHFADLYGVPTVALFGSTRPSTARGMDSTHYRLLHHPMSCVPCHQPTQCLLDKGYSCYAMPTAGEIVSTLQTLAPLRRK